LEPGPKTVELSFTTGRRGLATDRRQKNYFFLVVDFLVDFFDPFLAVVFLAMALDLLSMPRM